MDLVNNLWFCGQVDMLFINLNMTKETPKHGCAGWHTQLHTHACTQPQAGVLFYKPCSQLRGELAAHVQHPRAIEWSLGDMAVKDSQSGEP